MRKAYLIFCAAYAICAVAMFGTVWHRTECRATDTVNMCTETKVLGSLLASMFWPFPLSVIIQETK
jgi:hypothetical protein